ncbi:MAG: hypothetical protein ACI4TK_08280 [Agathobacter sp.]
MQNYNLDVEIEKKEEQKERMLAYALRVGKAVNNRKELEEEEK